jgi:hypothetical protein
MLGQARLTFSPGRGIGGKLEVTARRRPSESHFVLIDADIMPVELNRVRALWAAEMQVSYSRVGVVQVHVLRHERHGLPPRYAS